MPFPHGFRPTGHRIPVHGDAATGACRRNRGMRFASLLGVLMFLPMAPRPALTQGAISALESEVDQLATRTRPSIVTVIAQRTVLHRNPLPGQPARRPFSRIGSGVAVEENGVLTTASVVLGAERVLVRTVNGLQVEATVLGLDPISNVALLRVPGLRLPILHFAAREPQLGDWVLALGSSYRALPTQSVGNIAYRFKEPRQTLLQLTNEVYPGNSGGAALNSHGELVGMVQGELGAPDAGSRGPDAERRPGGMSFVLPTENLKPVYESLRRDGRVPHGFLGVSTRAASVISDTQAGLRVPLGALVENVQLGAPAARAGLRKGDLIVAFDGERVEYPEQLARWVSGSHPGSTVDLVWVRNELQQAGRVTLGESPNAFPDWMQFDPPAPTAADATPRMVELQRQIERLNRELGRLKGQTDSLN